ncbi:MAG: hypothetical protein QGG40_10915, partial [Myxococcota bacterium]|nr:hypothetical protein [Myxococcota bacterium]
DFKPSFRFLVPLLLPISLLAALAMTWLQTRWRLAGILVCLLIVAEWAGGWSRARTEAAHRARDMEERLMVGVWLGEHLPGGSLVALHSVGAIPWASRLPTVDLWGLTDAHIARVEVETMGTGMVGHEKTDYAYAFGRHPVVYLPEEDLVTVEPTRLPVPSAFPANFEERYEQLSVRLGQRWLNLFRLRDTSFESATR